jgi:hypothetical protein
VDFERNEKNTSDVPPRPSCSFFAWADGQTEEIIDRSEPLALARFGPLAVRSWLEASNWIQKADTVISRNT